MAWRAALPATYRALQLSKPGPTTNFRLVHLPSREPAATEVVVRVEACAAAYRDVLDRQGAFKFIKQPTVLGHEFAGSIIAVGDATSRYKAGDRVVSLHWDQTAAWPSPLTAATGAVPSMFGLMCDGGYADLVYSTEGALARAPSHMNSAEASALMSTFGTVWQAAFVRGGVVAGHHVLVTGASGGVGSAAVRLLSAAGCRVTAVTTSQGKAEAIRSFGADECIVASEHGQFKVPQQVDMVLDAVGGPTFASSLRAVKPGGKFVVVGNVTNATAQLPLGYIILNSISVIGSDSVERSEFEERLLPFLQRHDIRPAISDIITLEEAGKAHTELESRAVTGRIVLRIGETW